MLDGIGPLLLVGGGRMGEALLAGWLNAGLDARAVCVVEPDPRRCEEVRRTGAASFADPTALPPELRPRIIVVAVKPQALDAALPAYARFAGALTVSIVAGRSIGSCQTVLGPDAAIVRAMPNTPAAVGRGVSVLCANGRCSPWHRELAQALLGAVGSVHWIADEEQMHAVTAVSGSGPAYVFHMIEALAAAGAATGLPAALAAALARETVIGAGELAHSSALAADELRRDVTSPGGTTAAALEVLMGPNGLAPLMARAVAAAAERSRALA